MNGRMSALILLGALLLAGCGDTTEKSGGEAGTPAQSIPEAEPKGVGGTTNQ